MHFRTTTHTPKGRRVTLASALSLGVFGFFLTLIYNISSTLLVHYIQYLAFAYLPAILDLYLAHYSTHLHCKYLLILLRTLQLLHHSTQHSTTCVTLHIQLTYPNLQLAITTTAQYLKLSTPNPLNGRHGRYIYTLDPSHTLSTLPPFHSSTPHLPSSCRSVLQNTAIIHAVALKKDL